MHQWGYVADRADIHLRTRKERDRALNVHGETTFNAAKDDTFNAFLFGAGFFEFHPCFFAECFFAGEHSFAMLVFDLFEIDFNFIARAQFRGHAIDLEFAEAGCGLRI